MNIRKHERRTLAARSHVWDSLMKKVSACVFDLIGQFTCAMWSLSMGKCFIALSSLLIGSSVLLPAPPLTMLINVSYCYFPFLCVFVLCMCVREKINGSIKVDEIE